MSTAFPSIPAIDSLLSLFFEQQLSLKSISQRMAVSFGTLIRFMYNPDIRSLIEFAVQIQDQRHSLKANDAIAEALDDLRALRGLPENPTPADKDRQRKTLDSIRRAAESLRKSTTPRSRAQQQAPTKRDPRLDKPNTIFTTQLPAELEETPVPKRRIFFPGGSNDPAEMPVDPRYTLPFPTTSPKNSATNSPKSPRATSRRPNPPTNSKASESRQQQQRPRPQPRPHSQTPNSPI
jgi:hypothetical protein